MIAASQMNGIPHNCVRILHGLPVTEQLAECTMCLEDRLMLVQLGVIGHQVALCGPCLRDIQRHLGKWGEVTR